MTQQNQNGRNLGIDLLRLVSMFLVVVLHVLGQGGILGAARGRTYAVAWLLETCAYCAVDCFALISGYVGSLQASKKWKPAALAKLWLGAFVYSFGIGIVFRLIFPGRIRYRDLVPCLFPVLSQAYWYISAYAALFFVLPLLNVFFRACSDRELDLCAAISFLLFSCGSTLARLFEKDPFRLDNGYGAAWLVILYVLGAWIQRHSQSTLAKLKNRELVAGILLCVLLSWLDKLHLRGDKTMLVNYTSPTILLIAAALVLLFSRLAPQGRFGAAIRALSPAALGVYLIHSHPMCFNVLQGKFAFAASKPFWALPLLVLGLALGIFIPCLLVEKGRLIAFQRLGIHAWIDRVFDAQVRKRQAPEAPSAPRRH